MVNELNTSEATHEQMFEGIKQRLSDPEFIETSINQTADLETESQSNVVIESEGMPSMLTTTTTIKGNAEAKKVMTDEEATGYLNRYDDVRGQAGLGNLDGAREHWIQFGMKEGRTKEVQTELSNKEVLAYMNRYEDVKSKFGKQSSAELIKSVNEHWKETGMKENRNG